MTTATFKNLCDSLRHTLTLKDFYYDRGAVIADHPIAKSLRDDLAGCRGKEAEEKALYYHDAMYRILKSNIKKEAT